MPRYRLTVEYDGSGYSGFQAQAGQPTVQAALEAAVAAFCGRDVRVAAAGRTDAGVHATCQVVGVDLDRDWPVPTVMNAINAHLTGEAVAVLACAVADDGWHPRFSATGRRYLYRILNRPGPAALDAGRVWHLRRPLAVDAMVRAARALEGRHDFTTFRDAACQADSPWRTLDRAGVEAVGDEVHATFAARSFLHRQVRSMVGSLVQVGLGRWPEGRLGEVLAARDRSACGPVAPAAGLYLTGVDYPATGQAGVTRWRDPDDQA